MICVHVSPAPRAVGSLPPHSQPSCCDYIVRRAAESLLPSCSTWKSHSTVGNGSLESFPAVWGNKPGFQDWSRVPARADSAGYSLGSPPSPSFSLLFSLLFSHSSLLFSPSSSLIFLPLSHPPPLSPSLSSPLLLPIPSFPHPRGASIETQ